MAGDAESTKRQEQINEAIRSAESLYLSGRLSASCRVLRTVVATSAEAQIAEIRGMVPTPPAGFARDREGGREPTIEQVASGVFRFTAAYRTVKDGALQVSVEGLGMSENREVIKWVMAGPETEAFRVGSFTGRWESDTLTIPLRRRNPGPCLRVAISGQATRADAQTLLSDTSLLALSTLSHHARDLKDPTSQLFRELRARSEQPGGLSPGSLLWWSRSLLASIRGEWLRLVFAAVERGEVGSSPGIPTIIHSSWVQPVLVAVGKTTIAEAPIEWVLSVGVEDEAVRRMALAAKRDLDGWRERQIGGILFWHRRAASGVDEELVFPREQARARIWWRAQRLKPDSPSILLRHLETLDLETLRALLEDA